MKSEIPSWALPANHANYPAHYLWMQRNRGDYRALFMDWVHQSGERLTDEETAQLARAVAETTPEGVTPYSGQRTIVDAYLAAGVTLPERLTTA